MDKVLDLTVGPGNWETQEVQPLCLGNTSHNIVINGSFESPDIEFPDLNIPPDDWTVIIDGAAQVGLTNIVPAKIPISAPDGDQWLWVEASTSETASIHQLIGTVSDDPDAIVPYGFAAFASDQGQMFQTDSGYEISLWAGEPGNGGVMLAQEFGDIADTGLTQVQGTFMPLPDPKSKGADLYLRFGIVVPVSQPNPVLHYVDIMSLGGPRDALFRVRDVETQQGLGQAPQFWAVFLVGEQPVAGESFAETVLRNGDTVLIALTKDKDNDGIFAAQEQQYGSSDDAEDSDGDGLSDLEEVARRYVDPFTCDVLEGGWIVQVTLRDGSTIEFRVYSDPRKTDSDGDGVDDLQEKTDGTNPNSRDTDQDGLADDIDPRPTIQAGILYVLFLNAPGEGTSCGTAFGELSESMDAAISRNGDGDDTNDISEIWVSSGDYALSNQELPSAVKIYGGFAGGETRLGQRTANGVVNGTFINQGTPGSPMITTAIPVTGARLDGFAFQSSDTTAIEIESVDSEIEIANCFFFENSGSNAFAADFGVGQAGGAIASHGVENTLTLEDCVFAGNGAVGTLSGPVAGGAVSFVGGTLIVRRCTFIGNIAQAPDGGGGAFGGAVSVVDAAATIEDSRFSNNVVRERDATQSDGRLSGGAIAIGGDLGTGSTIRNCTLEDNEVDDDDVTLLGLILPSAWDSGRAGGGVAVFFNGQADFLKTVFVGNRAPMFGGGLYVEEGSTTGVTNCTFYGVSLQPSAMSVSGSGGS